MSDEAAPDPWPYLAGVVYLAAMLWLLLGLGLSWHFWWWLGLPCLIPAGLCVLVAGWIRRW